ncbi:MAG: serpin family protein, partial [Polyangiaceae bacterium]
SLQAIVSGLSSAAVDLTLPKFGYQGETISLKPLLQGLGMNVAFTPAADFTAIAQDPSGPIYIGDVLHQAFLRVDEKGTEAAAATAVIGVGTSARQDPKTITVDHPFFFTIRDAATNTVLFTGRVLDPSQ